MKIDLWKGRGIWLKPRIEREKQTHIRKAGKKPSQVVQALAICRHSAVSQAHIQTGMHTHAWFVTVLSILCSSAWPQLSWALANAIFPYFPSSFCSLDHHTEEGRRVKKSPVVCLVWDFGTGWAVITWSSVCGVVGSYTKSAMSTDFAFVCVSPVFINYNIKYLNKLQRKDKWND